MSFGTCCVPGCTVDINEGVLHKFPHPSLDKERFQRWVQNIGGPVTELDYMFIFYNRRVCRRHFKAVFHYPKNRLSKLAVPTLFTQGLHPSQSVEVLKEHSYSVPAMRVAGVNADKDINEQSLDTAFVDCRELVIKNEFSISEDSTKDLSIGCLEPDINSDSSASEDTAKDLQDSSVPDSSSESSSSQDTEKGKTHKRKIVKMGVKMIVQVFNHSMALVWQLISRQKQIVR